MAAIKITTERAALVDRTVREFVKSFLKPIASSASPTTLSRDQFLSVYHPGIHWYDHAFLVCRQGHEAVIGLQVGFRHCNDPFDCEIKAIIPTAKGAILEQVWVGRCSNDIVRPDGEVVVKASGKDFRCHVAMVIEIDAEGLITRIDEYYNRRWDDGVREQQYSVLTGPSIKEKL